MGIVPQVVARLTDFVRAGLCVNTKVASSDDPRLDSKRQGIGITDRSVGAGNGKADSAVVPGYGGLENCHGQNRGRR